MLYTIFLYQSDSGILMYDKSFQDISSGKMELFSSFFSALKTFISEMILKGSKELRNIEMGDYTIFITTLAELNADLVIIADKADHKTVSKLLPKILKMLVRNKNLFIDWNGNVDQFDALEKPLTELISSRKGLIGETSLIEKPEDFLKSMWQHKTEAPPETKEKLLQEKEMLVDNLNKTSIVTEKIEIVEKLLEISENVKDGKDFLKYQQEVKQLKDEYEDIKLKINYYLERIKSTLSAVLDNLGQKSLKQGDYKDVYLNLYSFSSKLRLVSKNNEWQKFKEYANILISKDDYEVHEVSEVISEILKMKENIEYYLVKN